ncbi:MAG: HAD hydrolase-like protein [Chloroflexota bacterium]
MTRLRRDARGPGGLHRRDGRGGRGQAFGAYGVGVLGHLEGCRRRRPVVGDRLLTDVGLARTAGMISGLVLTSATTLADAEAARRPPDVCLASLVDIIPEDDHTPYQVAVPPTASASMTEFIFMLTHNATRPCRGALESMARSATSTGCAMWASRTWAPPSSSSRR